MFQFSSNWWMLMQGEAGRHNGCLGTWKPYWKSYLELAQNSELAQQLLTTLDFIPPHDNSDKLLLNGLQFDVLDMGSQTSIKLISSFAKYLKSAAICNHLDRLEETPDRPFAVVEDRMWWNHETLGLRFETTTTTYAFISFVKCGLSGVRTQLLLRATGLIGDQLWNQAHASLVCTGRSSTQAGSFTIPKIVSIASDTWVSGHYSPAHKSISSSAQYVTLQKCFSHPSLVIYFFATPPIKLKLDNKYVENY